MEEKYYTPRIEEFHIGFEFEYRSSIYDKTWHKWNIEDYSVNKKSLDQFPFNINSSEIDMYEFRVKYLDQEDIESLGWVYDTSNIFYKNKYCLIINDIRLGSIEIILDNSESTVDFNLFNGTVKNKSELRKLMKQLEIIN